MLYYSGFCFVGTTDHRISESEDTPLRVLLPVLGLRGGPPARPALGRIVPGWKARTSAVEARESCGRPRPDPPRRGPAAASRGRRRGQGWSEEAANRKQSAALIGRKARHPTLEYLWRELRWSSRCRWCRGCPRSGSRPWR